MQGPPDAVPGVLPDAAEPGALGHLLDGVAHVREPRSGPELGDPGLERFLGHPDELLGELRGRAADEHRDGRVSVIPLPDASDVELQNVARD